MLVELIAKNAGADQSNGKYYPSPSKVGRCVRALTYHAIGTPADPFPDRALLVFEDGNWHEELIKDHIRKTVYQLDEWKGKNQRISIASIAGRMMDGEIDGLLTDPLEIRRILEIKSINHFGFERLKEDPLDEHRRQVNLYLHGIREAFPEITEAVILYKNKNTSAMKEFTIKYDEAQALADIEMFQQVNAWAKESKIPPRPYSYEDWHCQYCRWQKRCWDGYVDEVQKLATDVALSEEIETAARYYNELGAHISQQEKERDEIKGQLKKVLQDSKAKSGKAGEYLLSLSVSERDQIDKSLVPPGAVKKVLSERFTVKRIKQEGKNAKIHNHKAA